MPQYFTAPELRELERIEQARSYLKRAKMYADEANERYETGPGGRTTPVEMAAVNALVALAQMAVPAETDTNPDAQSK